MTIAQILVARDGITKEEADEQVADARAEQWTGWQTAKCPTIYAANFSA